jgi:hypothetical protein
VSTENESIVRVSFPRAVWVAIGLLFTVQLGMLAFQAMLMEDQRRTVRTQRGIAERQAELAFPLLEDLAPLAGDTRAGLPHARRLVDRATRAAEGAAPLLDDLRAAELGRTLPAVGALAESLLGADVARAVRTAPVVADDVRELLALQRDALPVLRQSLAVQRESLAVQRETLAIARETERHAESLDRKVAAPPALPAG